MNEACKSDERKLVPKQNWFLQLHRGLDHEGSRHSSHTHKHTHTNTHTHTHTSTHTHTLTFSLLLVGHFSGKVDVRVHLRCKNGSCEIIQ